MLLLAIAEPVFSQDLTYKKVDSTTFSLYQKQEWVQLSAFGESALKQDFDFYYLNLRMAIALFNMEDYFNSEKFFNKALKKDKYSAIANEYLYVIKSILNRPLSADVNYNRLPDSVRIRLDKKKSYFITYVYTEAGVKISSNENIEGNEPLVRVFVDQKITRRFNMQLSASYIGQQSAPWGSYDQTEIGLLPSYALNNNFVLNLGWRYINVRKDFSVSITQNFVDTANVETVIGPAIIITDSTEIFSNENDFLTQVNAFYAGITFHQNRFTFLAKGLVYIQNIDLTSHQNYETNVDKTWVLTENGDLLLKTTFNASGSPTFESDTTSYAYQAMLGATYTIPVYNNGVIIRFDAYLPLNDEFSNAILIPGINARIYKSLWFYGEWLQKKRIPLLYQDGNIFLNQSYQLNHRITLGLSVVLNKRFQLYVTYLNESKHYFDSNIDNSFNAAIFGINLKL